MTYGRARTTRSSRGRQARRNSTVVGSFATGPSLAESGPVGAERVNQHERVDPGVFVACRAVAAAQFFGLAGPGRGHGDPGGQQGVDDRANMGLNGDLLHSGAAQHRRVKRAGRQLTGRFGRIGDPPEITDTRTVHQ